MAPYVFDVGEAFVHYYVSFHSVNKKRNFSLGGWNHAFEHVLFEITL